MTSAAQNNEHSALLHAKLGATGSGAVRYAAAMHFYACGDMPAAMLEIYRACSKFDHEDPVAMAIFDGVPVPSICTACDESPDP